MPTCFRNTPMPTFTTSSRSSRRSSSVRRWCAAAGLALAAVPAGLLAQSAAQGIDASSILKPAKDSWLTYHGDYSGRRNSPLTQITPENVKNLGLSWVFQTGRNDQIK